MQTLKPAVFSYLENSLRLSWSRFGQTRAGRESLGVSGPARLSSRYKREQISESYIVVMAPLLNFLLLVLVCSSSASAAKDVEKRAGRLFYVSTTSSTSTLLTQSICFKTNTALAACGRKKKKRSVDDISGSDYQHKIDPTSLR